MDCEVIDIQDEELRTKPEYVDRLILIKRNSTPEELETNWLKCHGCNCIHPLTDYTVDDVNMTIDEEFTCKVISCGIKFHVTDGVLVQ